jgi:beta-glucosidase/6-phospho-beta-glucosidase/beta-galactosidase
VYDWSWIDPPVEYLVNRLKITPIMDLIHYGTPAWMPEGVADRRFPEALGAYAGAMARHFQGLVNHYSPHNEPQLTCLFCGLVGRWPPYKKSPGDWAKIGAGVARGMVLETEAIRAAIPDAVIISVDPWMMGVIDRHVDVSGDDPRWEEIHLASSSYPASLAYGKVAPSGAMAAFLAKQGVPESEVAWFHDRAARPDIVGYNFYPDFSFGWRESPDARRNDYTRGSTVPLDRAAQEAVDLITPGIRRAHTYFDRPVYLTETSAGLRVDARIAYIEALGRWVRRMRDEGLPLKGVNWWPLYETIQWDYREKADRPLVDFLYEGGWNHGLYRVEPRAGGDLERVPTPAVAAFREMIRRDQEKN